jgi:hypothetical protein
MWIRIWIRIRIRNTAYLSVFRIRDSGLGAFLTPGSGIRDGRKPASGSGIRDEQPGSYFIELRNHFGAFFGVKILKFFDEDPGSGIRDGDSSDQGSGILDGKKSDPGSGINIPDPQHCYLFIWVMIPIGPSIGPFGEWIVQSRPGHSLASCPVLSAAWDALLPICLM